MKMRAQLYDYALDAQTINYDWQYKHSELIPVTGEQNTALANKKKCEFFGSK